MHATISTVGQIAVQRSERKDLVASRFRTKALLCTLYSVHPSMHIMTHDAFFVLLYAWSDGYWHQELQIFSLARPTQAARMPKIKTEIWGPNQSTSLLLCLFRVVDGKRSCRARG
ncbi:hypothetical protein GGI42DRAFT_14583 [Trichoderma sp. SZMC 28013]